MMEWRVEEKAPPRVLVRVQETADDVWRLMKATDVRVTTCSQSFGAGDGAGAAEIERKERRLTLAEAFYLLAVDRKLPLGLGEREEEKDYWEWFSRLSSDFQRQFVLYQHFRRLGWRVKPGINYGALYVLYRGSPAQFHSEYIVYLQTEASAPSWNVIQSLTRVAADVKKTVLLCQVSSACGDEGMTGFESESIERGNYTFHGESFRVDAVAIRFWDAADAALHTPEASASAFAFQPQPVILKENNNRGRQQVSTATTRKKSKKTAPPLS